MVKLNRLTYLCSFHTHLFWFIDEAEGTVTAVHSRLSCTHHFLLEVPLSPLRFTHPTVTRVVIKPSTFRLKIFLIIICKWVVGFRVGHLWSRHIVFWQLIKNELNYEWMLHREFCVYKPAWHWGFRQCLNSGIKSCWNNMKLLVCYQNDILGSWFFMILLM